MAKDVNIHVKTSGVADSEAELQALWLETQKGGDVVEQTGSKMERASGKISEGIREAFRALVGPLGIAGIVTLAVAGIRRIIAAFDDMKKAAAEAVQELANQQRAAASYFEAFDAYSGPKRKAALTQARGVQAATGLPFEASMQLLETQKRAFGEISPQSTQQFAAYWQLHAGAQTTDLIRWMAESGIKTPEHQGQIMRMISAVAKESKLTDEELIGPITAHAQRFKYLGWSPEQAITYTGKALAGLSEAESSRVMRGLFESLEGFTEEEARKMKVPPKIAASEQARIEWLQAKVATMTPEQNRIILKRLYGTMAPYVTKMLFEPISPEIQATLTYTATPEAAEKARQNFLEWQKTEEVQLKMTKGKAVRPEAAVTPEKTTQILIREQGKAYLEYLRIVNPVKYQAIKFLGLSETAEEEMAARELWRTGQPTEKPPGLFETIAIGVIPTYGAGKIAKRMYENPPGWGGISEEERLAGVEKAAQQINIHYHNETIHNPVTGSKKDREIGAPFVQD